MSKQTAVEWLHNEIWSNFEFKSSQEKREITSKIEQAKAMEREQSFKFWQGGINCTEEGGKSFEQYYIQTYKGGEQ